MYHPRPSESKRWQGFSSATAKVKRGWEMCWSLLRSVLVYQTAAAPLMSDKQWAGAQSLPHLFFLSESWIYIMTWQAAQIIQLLPRPINTKLSALISALLHNEAMFAHTEVEMTQLDRMFSSRFGIHVDRFRWSFRQTLENKTRSCSALWVSSKNATEWHYHPINNYLIIWILGSNWFNFKTASIYFILKTPWKQNWSSEIIHIRQIKSFSSHIFD